VVNAIPGKLRLSDEQQAEVFSVHFDAYLDNFRLV
jgi:hypothetical protein